MKLNEMLNRNENLREYSREEINENEFKDNDSKLIKNRFENSRNFISKEYFFSNCQKKSKNENSFSESTNINQSNIYYPSISNLLLS